MLWGSAGPPETHKVLAPIDFNRPAKAWLFFFLFFLLRFQVFTFTFWERVKPENPALSHQAAPVTSNPKIPKAGNLIGWPHALSSVPDTPTTPSIHLFYLNASTHSVVDRCIHHLHLHRSLTPKKTTTHSDDVKLLWWRERNLLFCTKHLTVFTSELHHWWQKETWEILRLIWKNISLQSGFRHLELWHEMNGMCERNIILLKMNTWNLIPVRWISAGLNAWNQMHHVFCSQLLQRAQWDQTWWRESLRYTSAV